MSGVFPAVLVIVFWSIKQATPGKMIVGARIVDSKTGEPASIGQYIGRYLLYFVAFIPFGLGIVWVAFDRQKQGWHDKIAGTVVVRKKQLLFAKRSQRQRRFHSIAKIRSELVQLRCRSNLLLFFCKVGSVPICGVAILEGDLRLQLGARIAIFALPAAWAPDCSLLYGYLRTTGVLGATKWPNFFANAHAPSHHVAG